MEDPQWTEETEVFIRRVMVQTILPIMGCGQNVDAETEELIRTHAGKFAQEIHNSKIMKD